MGRLRLSVGVRYLMQGQVYLVREVLPQGLLLVENQSFGGRATVRSDDLYAAWGRGELRFEVSGPNTGSRPDGPMPTRYTIADLGDLPDKQRDEAWRRYRLILPLLRLPPAERTRRAIERYAESLEPRPMEPGRRRTRSVIGEGLSRRSLERWLHAFLGSGCDIRSLVPATGRQGGKGQRRLAPGVERVIQAVLADCAAQPGYRTADDIYLMVLNRVADENRHRPPDGQLTPPGGATVYRRIMDAGSASVLRRARSRAETRVEAPVSEGPRASHVLERVEIDHTLLDLFLVDEEDRLPIGRPTLTLAIDAYSRMPFGIQVGFEPPSYLAVMGCLLHGILPKVDPEITVAQFAGVVPATDRHPRIIAGFEEDPLYVVGGEYVLFLTESTDSPGAAGRKLYWTVNPFARYEVDGERVRLPVEADPGFVPPQDVAQLVAGIRTAVRSK